MTAQLLLVLAALLTPVGSWFQPVEPPASALERDGDPVATVQVELLPDRDSADQLAASIRARLDEAGLGHPVLVETVPGEPELPISYRVVIGPFFGWEDAERARTELDALAVHGFVREFDPLVGC